MDPVVVPTRPLPVPVVLPFEVDETETTAPVAETPADDPLPVKLPLTAMVPVLLTAPVLMAACGLAKVPIVVNVADAGRALVPPAAILVADTADTAPVADTDTDAPLPTKPTPLLIPTPVIVPLLSISAALVVVCLIASNETGEAAVFNVAIWVAETTDTAPVADTDADAPLPVKPAVRPLIVPPLVAPPLVTTPSVLLTVV